MFKKIWRKIYSGDRKRKWEENAWETRKILYNKLLLILLVILLFSPGITWLILWFNWKIINCFSLPSLSFDDYIKSTIAGALAVITALFTAGYYYLDKNQKLAMQRVYVTDKILSEIKDNKEILFRTQQNTPKSLLAEHFKVDAWHSLDDRVTLLPREIYTSLSLLYRYLRECNAKKSIATLEFPISEYLNDLPDKLYDFRKQQRLWYESRQSKEGKQAKKEFISALKESKKGNTVDD